VPSGLQDYAIGQRAEISQLSRLVSGADGPVLTDDYMGLLPLNGRRIYLQPFEMTQLSREGAWDQRPLLKDIEGERFPVIMMWKPPFAREIKRDRWTPEMLKEIKGHYEPRGTLADMVIYRPKRGP
jgi:hypothetical protein